MSPPHLPPAGHPVGCSAGKTNQTRSPLCHPTSEIRNLRLPKSEPGILRSHTVERGHTGQGWEGSGWPVAKVSINGAQLRCVGEHSVPRQKTCPQGGQELPEAPFQVTVASVPSGPQPGPCFAQKAHTAPHTGSFTLAGSRPVL